MGVFFHILSTGGGSGGSRITRYIAERDKDLEREGPGSRRLFSDDQDSLSYHRADRILDPVEGRPEKNDLIHFSVMIEPEDFDKLGENENDKLERFREAVREAMKGVAAELNAEELTWVAGIHRNSENPHAHIVMSKEVVERGTDWVRRIARMPKALLPHRQIENGKEVIVNGRIGDKFLAAIEKQQALYVEAKEKLPQLTPAEIWEKLASKYQKARDESDRERQIQALERSQHSDSSRQQIRSNKTRRPIASMEQAQISASWNPNEQSTEDRFVDFRIALGKHLEFEFRLAFAEAWHDRAVQHGQTYRFEVVDQSTSEERNISQLDVKRRAAARAARFGQANQAVRNELIEADLTRHADTLKQLEDARETKIAALGKDVGSLRGNLAKIEESIIKRYEMPADRRLEPVLSRHTLSELQEQAIRLNLPERVLELEKLRLSLAGEHNAPTRTDVEAAILGGQLNVARGDLMARNARLENFEASVHLTTYEVGGDRWSLAALDKQIARRREDTQLIPERAAHLNWRSLARLNYSQAARQQASADVERLNNVREEIVRQIEQRRQPLIEDRDLAREVLDVLENAHAPEQRSRSQNGLTLPEPKYERHQINALEASAETLRDSNLLREVHEWEKQAARSDSDINWEGRAVAREILSGLAVEQTKERLQHFLESKKVASIHLGNHETGSLKQVEARSLTDYLARTILESREQRDHRHSVKSAALEHHGRLVNDFDKASNYHAAAREFASEAKNRDPQFTDKELINLEIYAERQNNEAERNRYLDLSRTGAQAKEREASKVIAR
ncbi:MAG TPA: relaxase MobL [Pyrinomonadaceae bacterium]|nr:relaxase MobL [Pyrinomonadaceae bacterium]